MTSSRSTKAFDLEEALRPRLVNENCFTANDLGSCKAIYGGLLMGQALLAAASTVNLRACHAMQANFLRRADPTRPIDFHVSDAQTGRNFSIRRVSGRQGEREIFSALLSFREAHAVAKLSSAHTIDPEIPREIIHHSWRKTPPAGLDVCWNARGPDGQESLWMRSEHSLDASPALHQAALLYASDCPILEAGAARHIHGWRTLGLRAASLNQSSWIHAETDFNRWHLFCIDSPAFAGGTALGRGACYNAAGILVATLMQEALLRVEA